MKLTKAMRDAAAAVTKIHEAKVAETDMLRRDRGIDVAAVKKPISSGKKQWKDCVACGLPYYERACHCQRSI